MRQLVVGLSGAERAAPGAGRAGRRAPARHRAHARAGAGRGRKTVLAAVTKPARRAMPRRHVASERRQPARRRPPSAGGRHRARARRPPGRPGRPQRQRQDLAAAPDPGRDPARCRHAAPAQGARGSAGSRRRRRAARRRRARWCWPPTASANGCWRRPSAAQDAAAIAEVQTRLADIGAHAAPARAAVILSGLGLRRGRPGAAAASFSGGWRMRVALACVLFAEPDLLLLDEPTNHLDLEASLWLEDYLCRYRHTLLLVSHDRNFLNRVPQRIVHLEQRRLTSYAGGYDAFERARARAADPAGQGARADRGADAATCRRSSTASATRRARRARRRAGSRRSRSS